MGNIAGITTLTGQLMTNLIRGYSAYEVAVRDGGFDGTVEEWLASLVGESVKIEIVEDTDSSYIISFTVGDETVTTPNLRENLTEMESQVRDMQTQVSHHSAEIINIHNTDSMLDARITALEGGGGGGSDLENRIAELESSVEELDSSIDTISSQIQDLSSDVNEIHTSISEINSSVADLSSNVTDLSEGISGFDTRISGLTNRVGDLETANSDARSRLRALETIVADLLDHINSLESDISELNTKFSTYIDSTDIDLDQLSEIVSYIKEIKAIEFVDELPSPENANPDRIYVLRQSQEQEVDG